MAEISTEDSSSIKDYFYQVFLIFFFGLVILSIIGNAFLELAALPVAIDIFIVWWRRSRK
jgi:hypothetical protein